ncbi:MAG TPA: NlpC/P60 family protein [Nocardioidaceae bacterium]|nr:NlpC/P60 family protein [Nocardioidaceae bacterium]
MKRIALSAATAVVLATGAVAAVPATAAGAPAGYLQPTTSIEPAKGCVRLSPGMNGIKVKMVQRKLGLGSRWETMDSTTIRRVRTFQRRHGLRASGVVNRRTWNAMGFRERFCFDRWQARPALPADATRRQRVRTMIAFAMEYRGAEYVWGGAGRPKYGVDCSGLVLQSLYRAGLDPQPISIDKHVLPAYRTSKEMYEHGRLRHVRLARKKRGDLIFYRKDSTGDINHVAIYLGRGRMVEAKGDDVHVTRVGKHYYNQSIARTVVRPFS